MYNNPFMYNQFAINPVASRSIFSSLRSINWGNFLSNANKTLGVINQAIPIVYQVKPIINNAKTMFKIANTINSSDLDVEKNDNIEESKIVENNNKPTFYI